MVTETIRLTARESDAWGQGCRGIRAMARTSAAYLFASDTVRSVRVLDSRGMLVDAWKRGDMS